MFWRNKKQAPQTPVTSSGFLLGSESALCANSDDLVALAQERPEASMQPEHVHQFNPGTYVVPVGYRISGPIFTTRPVRIDGELAGRGLVARQVTVGPTGVLKQSAEVESLIVEGLVVAPIKARGSVELRAGGELRGEVDSPCLRVNSGGVLSDCLVAVGEQRDGRPAAYSNGRPAAYSK
jgi:cytoskeletal protein CcmA (bactofilin family)